MPCNGHKSNQNANGDIQKRNYMSENKSKKSSISRKSFLKSTALATLAGTIGITSCKNPNTEKLDTPNIISNKKYKWKCVTTWPPNFPVVGEGANLLSDWVREMSRGRLEIKVYGGGELVPALEVWDAVVNGAAEMGTGASYYWAGKDPATQFFTTVPFGMNAQQMNAWLYCAGGLQLWKNLYAKYNIIPFPGGNTGVQMGGWYNKEINTIADFKGLKMRMPGLGAKVLEKAGGTPVLSAGSEIYTNLERGVIDATEWIGPYHDYKMGFHDIAKYYYSPGWHEPGSNLEVMVNKRDYESLPKDLQIIIETACYRLNMWTIAEFEAKNNLFLQKIIKESNVELRTFSPEVLSQLKKYTQEVLTDITTADPTSKNIYHSYLSFQKGISEWSSYSEKLYYNL